MGCSGVPYTYRFSKILLQPPWSRDFNGTVGAVYGKMESIQILFQFSNYIKIEDAKDPITKS